MADGCLMMFVFFPFKESLKQERSNIEGIIEPCDTFIFELCSAVRGGPSGKDQDRTC